MTWPTMLNRSVLIVAHPDDEVLWFSSILQGVDEVVICFLDYQAMPKLGPGRRCVLQQYPLKKVTSLELPEAGTWRAVDWEKPVETEFGLQLKADANVKACYEKNFFRLQALLAEVVQGYDNVYTHNPWGEYGHADHVQIYRVLRSLKTASAFNLWFSNYCSNRSLTLFLKYVAGFHMDYVSLPTDVELAKRVAALYKHYDCWTWYDHYEWLLQECFLQDAPASDGERNYGSLFPLNMISMPVIQRATVTRYSRFVRQIRNVCGLVKNFI